MKVLDLFGNETEVRERTHAAEEAKRKAEEARATVWELSEAEHMAIERLKNRNRAL